MAISFTATSQAPPPLSGIIITTRMFETQSWEGHGPMPKDWVNPEDALWGAIVKQGLAIIAQARGAQVSNAISALHTQRKPTGMPPRWLP